MTQNKEAKYLLRNLHSFIKNDNIEQFINLVSLYPQIIKYKNNKNENLLFYSILKNSHKISSYLLALEKNLLIERNSNGENAIQASLSREASIDFFIDCIPSLSKDIIETIYKNLDNQGNTILMSSALYCTQEQFDKVLKNCPNSDIFNMKNKSGSNFTHFLCSNNLFQENIPQFLSSYNVDRNLFLEKNKTGTSSLMLAAKHLSKEDFVSILNYATNHLNESYIQKIYDERNISKLSIVEHSLLNKDSRVYSEITSQHFTETLSLDCIPSFIDKLKHNEYKHENIINYIKNNEPLDNDIAKIYYSYIFYFFLVNKDTNFIEKIISNDEYLSNFLSIDQMLKSPLVLNILSNSEIKQDFKGLENLPSEYLYSFLKTGKETFSNEKKIYSFLQFYFEKNQEKNGILNIIHNFEKIIEDFPFLAQDKRQFSSFLIQRMFYFKTNTIKELLEEPVVLKFCDKYKIKTLLGLVSYSKHLPYKKFLKKEEPIIPNFLNEHSNELINNKKALAPTYGYWNLFNDEIFDYFNKLENSSLFIDGLSLSCNKKTVDFILDKKETFNLLASLDIENMSNHFKNFFSTHNQIEEFILSLKTSKYLKVDNNESINEDILSKVFLNGLKLICFTQLPINNSYIHNLTEFLTIFKNSFAKKTKSSNTYNIINLLKNKFLSIRFSPDPSPSIVELSKVLCDYSFYNVIPLLDSKVINDKIIDYNISHFFKNEKDIYHQQATGFYNILINHLNPKRSISEISKPLNVQFTTEFLDILKINDSFIDNETLIKILDNEQPLEIFLKIFKNADYSLFNYVYIDKAEYPNNIQHASFLTQENFEIIADHYSNSTNFNIINNLFCLAKLNNLEINSSIFDKIELNYKNISELILLTQINPEIIHNSEVINYWKDNFIDIFKKNSHVINHNIFYFAAHFPDIALENHNFNQYVLSIINNEEDEILKSNNINTQRLMLFNYPRDFFESFIKLNYNNKKIEAIYDNINEDIFSNYELVVHIENLIMQDEIIELSTMKKNVLKF